ncbi:YqhG family protein [Evansella clarkii]|uniref:YqhG family protein n=1 Tax=Evansella clarkii TaxID=79879 RepID=UPI000B43EBF4|nr:YqhG family protein [Evansella clarkii]
MNQTEIHSYLKRFFQEHESPLLEESQGHLHVQLSIDMDKALMNRPFYWHYLEKINGIPNPMKLTLITDPAAAPEDLKGEKVHFGSPRLHQIFNTAMKKGSYSLLYESVKPETASLPLKPWLNINGAVSYLCDHKKDRFFSIGLSLITGEIIEGMYETISGKNFHEQIPDYCFTVAPIIKVRSGIERIKTFLYSGLEKEDHSWASDAVCRWRKDEQLLEGFYQEEEEKPEVYYLEKEALKAQYEPKIEINIINGGLFYFYNHPLHPGKEKHL